MSNRRWSQRLVGVVVAIGRARLRVAQLSAVRRTGHG